MKSDRLRLSSLRFGRAFTLVELLAVVGIISLLIALLMPNLDRAKELARRAVCSTQLYHQAGACNTYASDHNQRLPDIHDAGKVYNDGGNIRSPYWLSGTWVNKLIKEYGVKREFFYCPSNMQGWNLDTLWEHHFAGDERITRIIAYSYFGANKYFDPDQSQFFLEDPPKRPVFASTLIDKPAYEVLWIDLTRNTPEGGWWVYESGGGFGTRLGANHFDLKAEQPEGFNRANVDKSVKWVPWSQRTNGMNSWTQHW